MKGQKYNFSEQIGMIESSKCKTIHCTNPKQRSIYAEQKTS